MKTQPFRKNYFLIFRDFIYSPFLGIRNRRLSNQLEHVFKGSRSVLDVGCGDMLLAKHIKAIAKIDKWIGIDVLDYRKVNMPATIYGGGKIPFKNNSFDTVCAIFTLHHIKNSKETLREMERVSKKKIVVVEEIYTNKFQKYLTYAHDYFFNRLESFKINIPLKFNSHKKWKNIFDELDLKLISQKRLYQLPHPFNITHQIVYLLKK